MKHERAVWQGLQKEVTAEVKSTNSATKLIGKSKHPSFKQVTFLQSRASKWSGMLIIFLQFYITPRFWRFYYLKVTNITKNCHTFIDICIYLCYTELSNLVR